MLREVYDDGVMGSSVRSGSRRCRSRLCRAAAAAAPVPDVAEVLQVAAGGGDSGGRPRVKEAIDAVAQ